MFIGGGILAISWMKAWHIVMLKLAKTLTIFLLVRWIFLSIDFRHHNCYLIMHFWVLVRCFSILSYVTFMHSITSTSTLLFLSKTSKIGESTFNLLHLTIVLLGTNGVIDFFTCVLLDGKSKIIIFGWPWERLKIIVKIDNMYFNPLHSSCCYCCLLSSICILFKNIVV
jgi:hypothetical protein